MSALPTHVRSPCVQVCQMDEALGLCQGCHRTMQEIADWLEMSPAEQLGTLKRVADRRRLLGDRSQADTP